MKPTDPTYSAIEHEDEAHLNEIVEAVYNSYSTPAARDHELLIHARRLKADGAYEDLKERMRVYELERTIENTARRIVDTSSLEARVSILEEFRKQHGEYAARHVKRVALRMCRRQQE